MARAYNIFVLTGNSDQVVAAFTVKRECKAWLRRPGNSAHVLYVSRVPDGDYLDPMKHWSVEDFLADG